MKKMMACMTLTFAALTFATMETRSMTTSNAAEPMIAHMVYFSLKDNSAESRKKLVDACKKLLSKHPGTVFFAAGTVASELDREVNDRDWDVGLHIVFRTMADHDRYQEAPTHKQFIEENRGNWSKVRVFDSKVEQ